LNGYLESSRLSERLKLPELLLDDAYTSIQKSILHVVAVAAAKY
jgi:hypothetical protein